MVRKRWKVGQSHPKIGEGFRRSLWLAFAMLALLISFSSVGIGQFAAVVRPKAELHRTFPLSHFYETPIPLPPGKPGELIRKEDFDEYDLSPGVSVTRILYHSRSAQGADVASSGAVLYPEGHPPPGGWPVIAWAHDLRGIAPQCAPSLSRNLQNGSLLSMYVNLGYAVVATDYTGLGTAFPNAFSDMQSNGGDVIYSIPAARAAVPQLGARWIAIGTGDGSRAVIAVGELESQMHDPGYLGSIAVGDLADLQERYQRPDEESLIFLAYGIKAVFPDFRLHAVLTDQGQAFLTHLQEACGLQSSTKFNERIKPGWESNPFVQEYFARNRLGEKSAYGPILAISGTADPNGATSRVIARMCAHDDQVQLDRYEVSDPGAVIGDSVRAQIAWIQDRFAGRSASNSCPARH
jgi:Secretory lipase